MARSSGPQGSATCRKIVVGFRWKATRNHPRGAARFPVAVDKSSVRGISPPYPLVQAQGAAKTERIRRRGGNPP